MNLLWPKGEIAVDNRFYEFLMVFFLNHFVFAQYSTILILRVRPNFDLFMRKGEIESKSKNLFLLFEQFTTSADSDMLNALIVVSEK